MRTFNRKSLIEKRKHNRNNSTQAEAFLWGYLKGSKLDGDLHFDEEVKQYDKQRAKKLEGLGLKVIRFENQDVLYNLEAVLQKIKEHFKKIKIKKKTPPL